MKPSPDKRGRELEVLILRIAGLSLEETAEWLRMHKKMVGKVERWFKSLSWEEALSFCNESDVTETIEWRLGAPSTSQDLGWIDLPLERRRKVKAVTAQAILEERYCKFSSGGTAHDLKKVELPGREVVYDRSPDLNRDNTSTRIVSLPHEIVEQFIRSGWGQASSFRYQHAQCHDLQSLGENTSRQLSPEWDRYVNQYLAGCRLLMQQGEDRIAEVSNLMIVQGAPLVPDTAPDLISINPNSLPHPEEYLGDAILIALTRMVEQAYGRTQRRKVTMVVHKSISEPATKAQAYVSFHSTFGDLEAGLLTTKIQATEPQRVHLWSERQLAGVVLDTTWPMLDNGLKGIAEELAEGQLWRDIVNVYGKLCELRTAEAGFRSL